MRNAVCDLIACVCDERPVLVTVDDAQHVDEASEQLLDAVLTRIANKRLLITFCGAPERSSVPHHSSVLHLEPLSTEASMELWQAILIARELRLPLQVSRKCLDTAAGNPGHMELLAQQAAQDPEHFLIPDDLIALTDRRLSLLSPQARHVLEATALLDDAATAQSVSFLTGLAPYELLAAFQALESSDLIMNGPQGLRCRSGLIAERVHATAPSTVIATMEGRAAEYLEREQSGAHWSPSLAWRIASHWQRAGEHRRARAYLRACWQHAVRIGQPARASDAISASLSVTTEPEDRASLLDDLIGTQQASGHLQSVTSAVRERRSLSSRVRDTPVRTAQLAFDELEASILQTSNPAVHVKALHAHLASPLLDARRQIRAARLLMMAADGELDPSLASHTYAACGRITPEDPYDRLLKSHVFLIYHAIFGDSDEALRIAIDIQDQTQHLERSWYTAVSERNCAFARQLVAPGPSDYTSFERALAQAMDASMTPAALMYAGSLMTVSIDDGFLGRAESWRVVAEELAETIDPLDYPVDYLSAQVDLSLLTGQLQKARKYFECMELCSTRYQSRRLRNELFIYGLRVQQFSSGLASPHIHIPQLLEYHESGRAYTRHDDHMDVMWEALMAAGEAERATQLLTEYLMHYRRERRPCRFILRKRTSSDPAWMAIGSRAKGGALEQAQIPPAISDAG
jgi:hypothetical protein